jgi:hypothetical protein
MNTPAVFVLMCLAHAPTNYNTPAPSNYSVSEDRLHQSEMACLDRRDVFEHEHPAQRGSCKCQPFNEAPQTCGILPGVSASDPAGGSTFRQFSGSITLGQPGANASGNGRPRSVSPN